MSIFKTLHQLPVRAVGIIVALHTFIYGLGYLIPTGGFFQTVLYMNVTEIMPDYVFGVTLFIVGTILMYAFYRGKEELVTFFSTAQSFIWLFVTFVYFLNGFWLLGLGIGAIWSLLSGYSAFAFKHREATITELLRERLAQDR